MALRLRMVPLELHHANGGIFCFGTQEVSGALGWARNEATTSWAHCEFGVTPWPTPRIWIKVALCRSRAACFDHRTEVTLSNVPEISSVGMLARGGRQIADPPDGTRQT